MNSSTLDGPMRFISRTPLAAVDTTAVTTRNAAARTETILCFMSFLKNLSRKHEGSRRTRRTFCTKNASWIFVPPSWLREKRRYRLIRSLHFDCRHLLDELDNRRVIEVSLSVVHQRHQHVLDGAGQRQRDLQRLGRKKRVPQILLMQTDAEPGLEIARIYHRR